MLRPFYGIYNGPTDRTIRETVNTLRSSFKLLDFYPPTRVRRSRSSMNIAATFKNAEGVRVTVNGSRQRAIINEFLLPKIQDINVADLWFNRMVQRATQQAKPSIY